MGNVYGKVYLVGAGPGDPELLTLKGRRVLEQADSILFDHLANESLLRWARPDAERMYVGKKKSDHSHSQDEIGRMMIERARAGKVVVRLKGGDPFLFGRGGEEIEALHAAGIPFEVVPGVTAPLGIAAYSGVPLTHREHTSVVTFVTGHDAGAIDWSKVSGSETLVIYMGITVIAEIAARLIAEGRDPETPAMAVRWGTRPQQRTVAAPLRDLPAAIASAGMKPPATIIIGEVVRLRDTMNWYERLPLFGQRVVVTRAESQAAGLADRFAALGADVVEFPVIRTVPAADPAPLDEAIERLHEYDWVIFTSANGVRFFLERLDESARDLRDLCGRICAVGPATAEALRALHIKVDLMPSEHVAEGVVDAFAGVDLAGARVLLPRAAVARNVVPDAFRQRGAVVDVAEAYRTVAPDGPPPDLSGASWITFTSASTVKNFLALAGREPLAGARIASIGPATSEALRLHGVSVDAEADPHTTDGLVEAILRAKPVTPDGR